MDQVTVCPYCEGTYPHQAPTGCDYDRAAREAAGRRVMSRFLTAEPGTPLMDEADRAVLMQENGN